MKKPSGYAIFNRVFVCIVILFLAALFIFPGNYLRKVTSEIVRLADESISLVLSGEREQANENAEKIASLVEDSENKLKFFIDHQEVTNLIISAKSCRILSQAEEDDLLAHELERLKVLADSMRMTEVFDMSRLF